MLAVCPQLTATKTNNGLVTESVAGPLFLTKDNKMKLLWGLIETTPKHQHTFDADKWVHTGTQTVIIDRYPFPECSGGEIEFHQNTCLTCGLLMEKVFTHKG